MANEVIGARGRLLNPWRIAGWSIPVILLTIPAVAMRYTGQVDWSPADFVVMGALFGAIGLGFEFLMRHSRSIAYRAAAAIALVNAFLTIWTNLAVEMIGDDNPYNLLFGGVLLVALCGSILADFKPGGMARAMAVTGLAQLLVAAGGLLFVVRDGLFSMALAAPWLLAAALFHSAER